MKSIGRVSLQRLRSSINTRFIRRCYNHKELDDIVQLVAKPTGILTKPNEGIPYLILEDKDKESHDDYHGTRNILLIDEDICIDTPLLNFIGSDSYNILKEGWINLMPKQLSASHFYIEKVSKLSGNKIILQ